MKTELMMGNEAIARGLIEAGCQIATAYPGTPSTEVLQAVIDFRSSAAEPLHIEWSVNEKIAFEVALAGSYTGKRVATVMKQVGLNVAADPFMRTAYLGVKGGMVTVRKMSRTADCFAFKPEFRFLTLPVPLKPNP